MSDARTQPGTWAVRGRVIPLARPLVMGVLNVTPDSFSDGGAHATVDQAVAHAERLLAEGADLVDVGGESTAPGRVPVPAEVERARVVPVIAAIAGRIPDAVVSVDTMKAAVAEAALAAGVREAMRARRDAALAAGIAPAAIVLDPGIGFGRRTPDAVTLLRGLDRLATLGHPLLVGVSRKRFVGDLTGVADPVARVHGGVGAHVAAVARGARIVRTHDVAATRQALDAAWPLLAPA